MNPAIRKLLPACCVLAALLPGSAGANGISPPRPREALVSTAVCHENSGTRKHTIHRARVGSGATSTASLNLRVGAADEEIAIAKLTAIEFTGKAPDAGGYLAATLLRRGESGREAAAVKVRAGGAALQLSGYRDNGQSLAIDIAQCRRIEFPDAGAPDPLELKRSMKKA